MCGLIGAIDKYQCWLGVNAMDHGKIRRQISLHRCGWKTNTRTTMVRAISLTASVASAVVLLLTHYRRNLGAFLSSTMLIAASLIYHVAESAIKALELLLSAGWRRPRAKVCGADRLRSFCPAAAQGCIRTSDLESTIVSGESFETCYYATLLRNVGAVFGFGDPLVGKLLPHFQKQTSTFANTDVNSEVPFGQEGIMRRLFHDKVCGIGGSLAEEKYLLVGLRHQLGLVVRPPPQRAARRECLAT
jgi:hypothetical protein